MANGFQLSQQVQAGGVPQHRVSSLADDLSNLFGAVGQATQKYAQVGEQAAKLQASEDARLYQEQVSTLTSALAHAKDDPDAFFAVKSRIDELSNEFVAKRDTFKGNQISYDAYNNYASDIVASTKMQFEPMYQKGFVAAALSKKAKDIEHKANVAGTTPTQELLDLSVSQGKIYGESLNLSERQVALPNLSAIDTTIKGRNPADLINDISENRAFSIDKTLTYLNTLTGSLVTYKKDKDGNVTLDTKIESQDVREMYMERYKSLFSFGNQVFGKDAENVDIKVLSNNVAQTPRTFGTHEQNIATATKLDEFVKTYEGSVGKQIESLSESSSYINSKLDTINFARMSDTLYRQLSEGRNIYDAQYIPAKSFNADGKLNITDGEMTKIGQSEADQFVEANVKDQSNKLIYGQEFDINFAQSLILSKKSTLDTFKDSLDSTIPGISKISTISEARNRMNALHFFADKSKGLPSFDSDIYSDVAGVMNTILTHAEREAKANPKEATRIYDAALEKITDQYKAIPPARIVAKELNNNFIETVKDNTDIDGLFNDVDDVSREAVIAAVMSLKTLNNPNPTAKQVGQFISDYGVSTSRWFATEGGLAETLLISPLNSNGQRVKKDLMIDGILAWMRKGGKSPSDYIVENDTMEGMNNRIIIRYKNSNAIVATVSGDQLTAYESAVVNKRRKVKKEVAPNFGVGSSFYGE